MDHMMDDIRFALRSFRKHLGVTILIVATLGLGIGANSAIFSMVYHVLLGPLPFADGDRLVKIQNNRPGIGQYDVPTSVQTLFDYDAQSTALSDVFEYHQMSFTLLGHGDPSFVQTGVVSWDYFNILGIAPVLGRTFVQGEDEPGAEPLILLSNRYWYEKFGGDPDVVGTTLQMNNRAHRVVGVLPPMPAYPMDNDIWIASATCPFRGSTDVIDNRARPFVMTYGKLAEGASLQQGSADINSIVQRLQGQYPDAYPVQQGFTANLLPLRDEINGDTANVFYLLLGMTGLVLLIACANVANLNLARMASRKQELAIREALGASPARISRQVLTESVLLALAGGVLGLVIAFLGIGVLADFAQRYTPLASEVRIDGTVLLFSLVIAVITGLASGSAAILQRRNINQALKEGSGNVTVSSSGRRWQEGLLVTQFSLAFIILTSAALVSLSLYRLSTEPPGFRTERILSTEMTLNFTTFNGAERRREFLRYLEAELPSHPQIASVGASSTVPLEDRPTQSTPYRIDGHPTIENSQELSVFASSVSPNYFSVLEIPLINGRFFQERDDERSPPVYIINAAMADHYFPGINPVGYRISPDGGINWGEIVGVVGNSRSTATDTATVDTVYVSYLQLTSNRLNLFVQSSGSNDQISSYISDAVRRFDPQQAITSSLALEEIRDGWLAAPRLVTQLITVFALLAFSITLSGVVGVVAYNVSQRTKEIGIRVALGASPRRIRMLVMSHGVLLALLGILCGGLIMLFAAPTLAGLLYATSPVDPGIYLLTAVVITVIAIVAISFPTSRAVRIDPYRALRDQ